ncbi:uncharacterized protein LOC143038325 [Oratosquilla oratoria]|uniref:uncharacterized protein LOC143038325 n=1 Tax=Oratosquilla oratoria TaxID=337810 RepID=UPI003F75DE03
MSLHFSANQFDPVYRPTRLGNWEVARLFPERPRQRKGPTRVIANDRGHLLPGVPRSSSNPWGPLTPHVHPGEQLRRDAALGQCHDEHLSSGDRQRQTEVRVKDSSEVEKNDHLSAEDDPQQEEEGRALQVTGASLLSGRGAAEEGEDERVSGPKMPQKDVALTPASSGRTRSGSTVTSRSSGYGSSRSSSSSYKSTSSSTLSTKDKKLLKDAAHLPPDTIEDALLSRRPEDDLLEKTGSRALAIRLVDRPAPTNCTKYMVLRPHTAPTPSPSPKPPLPPERPKTAKIARKIPEIEFALKWELKEEDVIEEEVEEGEEGAPRQSKSHSRSTTKDLATPRSVGSTDSGVHVPRAAWADKSESEQLKAKLENLERTQNGDGVPRRRRSPKRRSPESGYGTPMSAVSSRTASTITKGTASSASSSSGRGRGVTAGAQSKGEGGGSSRRISIDSPNNLTQSAPRLWAKSGTSTRSTSAKQTRDSDERSPKESVHSSSSVPRRGATPTRQPAETKGPPAKDPLEIMETLDSVFHRVPVRDTGWVTSRSSFKSGGGGGGGGGGGLKKEDPRGAQQTTTATQTVDNEQPQVDSHPEVKVCPDHPNHMRSRSCVACEMRALEDPPRKFRGPSGYKAAFRAGKVHPESDKKPPYLRQSDKYPPRLQKRVPATAPRRLWAINTLSAPFCNRPGYGQDQYPDHLRLRTTYHLAHDRCRQKEPKLPHHQHTSLIKKLYL